jgi:hypothetical protein
MNTNDDLTLDFQESEVAGALPAHLHSRREFLKRFGGGIAIFVGFGGKLAVAEAHRTVAGAVCRPTSTRF